MSTALDRAEGTDVREHRTKDGALEMWKLGPRVYVVRVEGHMDLEMAKQICAYSEQMLQRADGTLHVFLDYMGMSSYDSLARKEMTNWMLPRLKKFTGIHVVTRSKIVEMGLIVANLAYGGKMTTHNSMDKVASALAIVRRSSATVAASPAP